MKERVRTTGDKDGLAGELQEEGVERSRLPDEQTEEVAPLASNIVSARTRVERVTDSVSVIHRYAQSPGSQKVIWQYLVERYLDHKETASDD